MDPKAQQFAEFAAKTTEQLRHFLPELLLIGVITLLVLAASFMRREQGRHLAWPTLLGTLAAMYLVWERWMALQAGGAVPVIFSEMVRIDGFANFFCLIFLAGTAITIPLVYLSRDIADRPLGEFFAILISAVLGAMLMAEAVDLLMIFIAVELLSVPSYVLTGWIKNNKLSSEAALKYVIYGSVAAGLMLYGFSLFYGMTGSLQLGAISKYLAAGAYNPYAVALATFLAFAGFGYKMAAVPMQFWAPDVYQGAPTSVTAWLSVASKAAGIAVFIRFMEAVGIGIGGATPLDWKWLVALISAITMIIGNLGALHQTNVKRMLAYSSVAHVGYILMGIAAFGITGPDGGEGWRAVAFYVVAYLLMNLGAFACVILAANQVGGEDLAHFRGLGYRAPRLGFALVIFLVSLLGLPPTAGFVGKLQLFMVAIRQDLVWLAVVAAINSAISGYYYFKIVRAMYLEDSPEGSLTEVRVPALGELIVGAHLAAVIALGLSFDVLTSKVAQIGSLR
jgi:NADH-quinone oxidoreductase subunit N